MPVTPPTVKRNKKPATQRTTGEISNCDPNREASQLKILIEVGTAIIIVAEVKYARVSKSIPTVNIWWAQTTQPKNPIAIIAYTIPKLPKISFLPQINITE
jgi:hypothetical protein